MIARFLESQAWSVFVLIHCGVMILSFVFLIGILATSKDHDDF